MSAPTKLVTRGPAGRVAIVSGLRTPFAKRGSAYAHVPAVDLARLLVRELLARAELDPREATLCVYGRGVAHPRSSNIARDVALGTPLPKSVDAFSVARAGATSFQALTSAAESMLVGAHDVAIVGGADSASERANTVSRKLATVLAAVQSEASFGAKIRALAGLSAADLALEPVAQRDPQTGLTTGQHAERVAKTFEIGREEQDRFALRSHHRAAAAYDRGLFDAEVMHVVPPPNFDKPIGRDNLLRRESRIEDYASLVPAFEPTLGSVTAGNASKPTDGAGALLLMTEEKAKALGYPALGYLRAWAYAAIDPDDGLLMGPAFAVPIALDRAGLTMKDIDLFEMHEDFAAQVLANRRALASRRFAEDRLGRSQAVGEIDDARFNVHGGSLALGHPVAATGARMMHTALRELGRRGGKFALVSTSATGALGAAIVLEAAG